MAFFTQIILEVNKKDKRKASMGVVIGFTTVTLSIVFQTVIPVWDIIHILHSNHCVETVIHLIIQSVSLQ